VFPEHLYLRKHFMGVAVLTAMRLDPGRWVSTAPPDRARRDTGLAVLLVATLALLFVGLPAYVADGAVWPTALVVMLAALWFGYLALYSRASEEG